MRKRSRFLVLILIVAFVFFLGFGVGSYFVSLDGDVSKFVKESELNSESFLVEQQLIETFGSDCVFSQGRLSDLSKQLWNLGKLLDDDSAKSELGESGYDYLKRKFHLMQIKTYSLYKRIEESCGKDVDVILFYFKKDDLLSKKQGDVLDQIGTEYDARVFAIELDYSPELMFLQDYYSIYEAPSLVINFDNVLREFNDFSSVENFLENETES